MTESDPLADIGDRTRSIVEFLADTGYRDLPGPVVDRTELLILDTVGSLLAASNPKYDPGRLLAEFIEETTEGAGSSVVGYGVETSVQDAALVNGTMGYFCDLDAHHPEAITHTPAVVVPSALAIGEREAASGAQFVTAVALGIEMACRVSLSLNADGLYRQGFHPTPIAGGFGAAVAGGKLYDANPAGYATALGLAQTQASGTLAWKDEHTESLRPFNPGIAARNGVTAARLAKAGFGSPVDPFDGEYDVFRAFADGTEERDRLNRNLGDSYAVMDHAFKRYPSVAFSHTGLDALLELLDEHDVDPDDITGLTVRFPAIGGELIDGTDLRSHSLRYLLAVAAVDGGVTIDDIVEDRTRDPAVQALLGKITVVRDEQLDALFPERYPSIVELETRTDEYTHRIDYANGTPEKPFDRAAIEAKFERLTEPVTSRTDREAIIAALDGIESIADVSELGDRLR